MTRCRFANGSRNRSVRPGGSGSTRATDYRVIGSGVRRWDWKMRAAIHRRRGIPKWKACILGVQSGPRPTARGTTVQRLGWIDMKARRRSGVLKRIEKGIYDLGGNVWEWCEDWWNSDQKYRVLRGASWFNDLRGNLVSSFRDDRSPENRRGSLLSSLPRVRSARASLR